MKHQSLRPQTEDGIRRCDTVGLCAHNNQVINCLTRFVSLLETFMRPVRRTFNKYLVMHRELRVMKSLHKSFHLTTNSRMDVGEFTTYVLLVLVFKFTYMLLLK